MASSDNGVRGSFDSEFTETFLAGQKYVWFIVAVLLAVTFSGLLRRGPLARKTIRGDALTITFERIPHFKTPTMIDIVVKPAPLPRSPIRLRVTGAIAGSAGLQHIVPTPVSAEPLQDGFSSPCARQRLPGPAKSPSLSSLR